MWVCDESRAVPAAHAAAACTGICTPIARCAAHENSVSGRRHSRVTGEKWHQPLGFLPDHGVTLAAELLQYAPVQQRDLAAAVFDRALLLQFAGGLGDAFAANTEHVRHQFLGHGYAVARQAVQTKQQPATQLLVNRVVPVADPVWVIW